MSVVQIVLLALFVIAVAINWKSLRAAEQAGEKIWLLVALMVACLLSFLWGIVGTFCCIGIIMPWLTLKTTGRIGRRIYFIGLGILVLINAVFLAFLHFGDGSAHGSVIFLFASLIFEVIAFNIVAWLVSAHLASKNKPPAEPPKNHD